MSAVAGNFAKRSALSAVAWANASSTTKPRSAIRCAGARSWLKLRLPQRSRAACQVAGVPGTPTDRPELTAFQNSIGLPSGSMNERSCRPAGAVSRPSRVVTSFFLAS